MKKIINITGIISLVLIFFGSYFKLMHFPGAAILLIASIFLFSFFFWPAALRNNYIQNYKRYSVWLYITAFICGFLNLMAALFKILHWPGAGVLLIVSIPLPFVLFLPVFIYHNIRSASKSNQNLLYVMTILIFIAVFSVFLGLTVGGDVLNADVKTGKGFVELNDQYKHKNDLLYEYFGNDSLNERNVKEIKQSSEKVRGQINDLKKSILSLLDDDAYEYIVLGDSIDLDQLKYYSDSHKSMIMLQVYSPDGRASELKQTIKEFRNYLNGIVENEQIQTNISNILETDDYMHQETMYSWEFKKFDGLSNLSLINVLTSLESNIRIAENEVLTYLKNKNLLADLEEN